MKDIQTSSYQSNGCLVMSLDLKDLSTQILSTFIGNFKNINEFNKVIVCLDENRVITSLDIQHLERFINVLKLMGKSVVVCGLQPDHVKVLVEFVTNFNFTLKSNVKDAINSL